MMSQSGRRKKWRGSVERGEYYQAISRTFLKLRGAPFILSSREIGLIAEWEDMQIPLPVVLEGIKQAFEYRKRRRGLRSGFFSLNGCGYFVLEAYKMHRDRRIGGMPTRSSGTEMDKGERILGEIERFLSESPRIPALDRLFKDLREDLRKGRWDEESLEKKEGMVEDILAGQAAPQERADISTEVTAEFRLGSGEEFDRIMRLKLIKELRRKYRVPHISPFYY